MKMRVWLCFLGISLFAMVSKAYGSWIDLLPPPDRSLSNHVFFAGSELPSDFKIYTTSESLKVGYRVLTFPEVSGVSTHTQPLQGRFFSLWENGDQTLHWVDDQLIVVVKQDANPIRLKSIMDRYFVTDGQILLPSLAKGKLKMMVLALNPDYRQQRVQVVLTAIQSEFNDIIEEIEPNRYDFVKPHGLWNDVELSKAWHIRNQGQPIYCQNRRGSAGSDARVDEVWEQGIDGRGIRVGVIDFDGFDYFHPDMEGQFDAGYDAIRDQPYDTRVLAAGGRAHGMAVAGIIGMKANNNLGGAGIAFGARIVPFLIDGSEVSLLRALQKALDPSYAVDIMNCSFGTYQDSPALKLAFQQLHESSGYRNSGAGVLIVASHGNDGHDDRETPQYPAAWSFVLSVGASTPDDRIKSWNDGWQFGQDWSSNYGNRLDVLAPGVCLYTTDLGGAQGYSTSDYIGFSRTSAAAPVVSGIAALIMSRFPSMDPDEVKSRILSTSDRIDFTAQSQSGGFSSPAVLRRVNAAQALSGVSSTPTENPLEWGFVINPFSSVLSIHVQTMEPLEGQMIAVYSSEGKTMVNHILIEQNPVIHIPAEGWNAGLYILEIHQGKRILRTKILKL